jgi:hypothetical protein
MVTALAVPAISPITTQTDTIALKAVMFCSSF